MVALKLVLLFFGASVHARDIVVACGNIVVGSFNKENQEIEYHLDLQAGDVLDLTVEPEGEVLRTRIGFLDPLGASLLWQGEHEFLHTQSLKFPSVSANGRHRIVVMNYQGDRSWHPSFAGEFKLHITCIRSTGEEIVAGARQAGRDSVVPSDFSDAIDSLPSSEGTRMGQVVETINETAAIVDGVERVATTLVRLKDKLRSGRRRARAREAAAQQRVAQTSPQASSGLVGTSSDRAYAPAQDSAANGPRLGELLPGSYQIQSLDAQFGRNMPPQGAGTTGFFFLAEEGATVLLSVSRATGNLSLSVEVLDMSENAIFQGLLANSMPQLQVPVTLPRNGQYLVRIQRNEMIPVAQPTATGFNVEVTRQEP